MTSTNAALYQEIADTVIGMMKEHGANWTKPWTNANIANGGPVSMSTGKGYNGINFLQLSITQFCRGYADNRWATFQQWKKLGASVRKGEKGARVVLFKPLAITETNDAGESSEKTIALMKGFVVFNAEQCDNVPARANTITAQPIEPRTAADTLAAQNGARVVFANPTSAHYSPSADHINMPRIEQFVSEEAYAATLCHELVHWTGHKSRLDRLEACRRGDATYAREELVAELGAAMLCGSLGISPEPRADHARYLSGWIKLLADEPKAIFKAAAAASKAAAYLEAAASQEDKLAA